MFSIIDGNINGFFTSSKHKNVSSVLNHLHGNLEIIVVTEGSVKATVNGTEYSLSAGEGIIVSPFFNHAIDVDGEYTFYALMFTKELIPHFYSFLKNHTILRPVFTVSDATLDVLRLYLTDTRHKDEYFRAFAVLGPVIYDAYSTCHYTTTQSVLSDSFYVALEYMSNHTTEKITREDVAKAAGIHPTTLSNFFSKYSYSNFNTLLNQMRCSYAISAMRRDRKLSFSEIAYTSGFGSIRSFNRAFLELYSMTPTEFKNSL